MSGGERCAVSFSRGFAFQRPIRACRPVRAVPLLAILWLAGLAASAQTPTRPVAESGSNACLAADEQTLWLVEAGPRHSQAYRRGVNGVFTASGELNAPIASLAATRGTLYVFTSDGSFYSWTPDGWSAELNLPRRTLPMDLAGTESDLYALTASPLPGELPRLEESPDSTRPSLAGLREPQSQPFDPGSAQLSILRYDSRGWVAVAACPADIAAATPPRLHPRLGVTYGTLCLFRPSADGRRIECQLLDAETGHWRDGGATPELPDLSGFWVTTVSRVPTLVAAVRAGGDEDLQTFRLLGVGEGDVAGWRRVPLRLSDLPAGVYAAQYTTAFGFNQHVALLMSDREARAYVRFGRMDANPAETTVPAADVFAGQHGPERGPAWLQTTALLALCGILLALFLFRRRAMVHVVELPPDCLPAFALQRVAACVIDVAPFLLLSAATIRVDWQTGLRELSGWGVSADAVSGHMPRAATLLWWGLGTAGSTIYCLVMELLTFRTVGKVLMGTRVLSETGTQPKPAQVIVRNLLRFVEVQPPLWILGFLVVLSRNRQRLGDIFARTVVVRQSRLETPRPPDE